MESIRRAVPVLLLSASLALSACATRPGDAVLNPVAERAKDARIVDIHVVTTRERASPERNDFTTGRADRPNYASFAVSVPPDHRPGRIEWPREGADPRTSFAVTEQAVLSRRAFLDRLAGAPGRPRDVTVFVHGFNTNVPEAVFRAAQLAVDSGRTEPTILFAWPSDAVVAGYVADRDSAAFSRDALADTLIGLAEARRIGRITLFAHSMGGWLAVEAVRQLRLAGRDDVIARLAVVLAAPDIDLDLFDRQMAVVGPLDPPLTVLTAPDDRALLVSGRLGGMRERVGALDARDPRAGRLAQERGLAIVDISQVRSLDPLNHDRFVALASMAGEIEGGAGGLRRAGAFVFDAVGTAISSPFTLVSGALAGE